MSLIQYDPFVRQLNTLFNQALDLQDTRATQGFKVDIREDDKSYTVHAELPGVDKDNIHITIDGDLVSISAEVKSQHEEKSGHRVLRSERYYGKVSRTFQLGQSVDNESAEAKLTDGVLELTLPKKAAITAKRLVVKDGKTSAANSAE